MFEYIINFTGFGANNAVYMNQEVSIQLRHDWDTGQKDATEVMYMVHTEIKKHFNKYRIISIEKAQK